MCSRNNVCIVETRFSIVKTGFSIEETKLVLWKHDLYSRVKFYYCRDEVCVVETRFSIAETRFSIAEAKFIVETRFV